jgi:hypothetical protein
MNAAQHVLDQAYTLERIEVLGAEPGVYAERLAAELGGAATLPELEARDAMLVGALGQIDAMIVRAMKLRLDHVLGNDTSIGTPTRNVFSHTITSYLGRLPLFAQRVRDVAARGGAADPDRITESVLDATRSVLGLREAVRAGVLALIGTLAQAAAPEADRRARDRGASTLERRAPRSRGGGCRPRPRAVRGDGGATWCASRPARRACP